jgi:hypothetical protein
MTGNRIAAILVGLAIMFPLDRWGGFQWYSALALWVFGYAVARYVGYFVRERRYVRGVMDAAKRDQISN